MCLSALAMSCQRDGAAWHKVWKLTRDYGIFVIGKDSPYIVFVPLVLDGRLCSLDVPSSSLVVPATADDSLAIVCRRESTYVVCVANEQTPAMVWI